MQTLEGSLKAQRTIIERYPLNEHGKNTLRVEMGRKGGKAFHLYPRGFAANKRLASVAGTLGGKIGSRIRNGRTVDEKEKAKWRKDFDKNYAALMQIHVQAQATSPETEAIHA